MCPQPLEGGEKIAGADDRTIDVAGQITRNEHEEFGGIAEAVISQRQPGNEIVRNVIEENHPQPYAAEQIEPEVTLDDIRGRRNILLCHDACPLVVSRSGSVDPALPGQLRARFATAALGSW